MTPDGDGETIWVDEDAGPMVPTYMLTGGRVHATSYDPVAFVLTAEPHARPRLFAGLGPEHFAVLDLCRRPLPLAEVAARLDLSLHVVRVLLDDLMDRQLISVFHSEGSRSPTPETLDALLRGLRDL